MLDAGAAGPGPFTADLRLAAERAAALATTTQLLAGASPATVGRPVVLTATVITGPGLGLPGSPPVTGAVAFAVDGQSVAAVRLILVNGLATASLTLDGLAPGDHRVVVAYGGDARYAPSDSGIALSVVGVPTATRLTADPNPSAAGQAVTLTAAVGVPDDPAGPAPTGTVTFTVDGEDRPPVPVATAGGRAVATLVVAGLGPGAHTVRASYGGDGRFGPSASAPAALLVNGAVLPAGGGPRVTALWRVGIAPRPTTLVLGFDRPLDPASAQDASHYRLVDPGGRALALASASYDPGTQTLTLRPRRPLGLFRRYALTLSGLVGASGLALDGDGDGHPGGDAALAVTRASLVPPAAAGPRRAAPGPGPGALAVDALLESGAPAGGVARAARWDRARPRTAGRPPR
jgi:hypothetical protein